MTKRQTVIAILGLIIIVACIVVAMMNTDYSHRVGARGVDPARDVIYLTAGGVGVLDVILALSPWGRSKD